MRLWMPTADVEEWKPFIMISLKNVTKYIDALGIDVS